MVEKYDSKSRNPNRKSFWLQVVGGEAMSAFKRGGHVAGEIRGEEAPYKSASVVHPCRPEDPLLPQVLLPLCPYH